MAWYWSDDVARAAIDAGLVSEHELNDWLHRPVAFAAAPDLDPVDVAGSLLGLDDRAAAGAA